MTTATYKTPSEVAVAGFRVLVEKLGPGGAMEFIHQYESGEGDYTKGRKRILKGFRLEELAVRGKKGPARHSRIVGSKSTDGHLGPKAY